MQRPQLENIIDGYDKDGIGISRAIERDDEIRLKELTEKVSDAPFVSWVKKATEHKSYKCLSYLLSKKQPWTVFSEATLIACKENNQTFLDMIIQCRPTSDYYGTYIPNELFLEDASYIFGLYSFTRTKIDPDNGYTALHWSVIHNNKTLMQEHKNDEDEDAESKQNKAYYVRDHSNRTALDLAIMLDNIPCARELAAHMSFKKAAINMTLGTLKNIIQHDIKLKDESWDYFDSEKEIKNKLIELIDNLDDDTKEKALNQAMDSETLLGKLLVLKHPKQTDHDMNLLLAKKLLSLLDKKEQESKKKTGLPISSTSQMHGKLKVQPETTHVNAPLLANNTNIEPVYLTQDQIPHYLNTTQFKAIFKDLPDMRPTEESDKKPMGMLS